MTEPHASETPTAADPPPAPAPTATPAPTAVPQPATPTHVVEVYLAGPDRVFGGDGRTERFFYESEAAGQVIYDLLYGLIRLRLDKSNDLPTTTDIADLYGRGVVIAQDIRGVRLLHFTAFDDWNTERAADAQMRIAQAKHVGVEMAARQMDEMDEMGEATPATSEPAGYDQFVGEGGGAEIVF